MGSKKEIGIMLTVIIVVSVFSLTAIALGATEPNKVGTIPENSEDQEFLPGEVIREFKQNNSVSISAGQRNKKTGSGIKHLGTQTIIIYILYNVPPNSFPMFSNAEYVNLTIGADIITLTLDSNASFDGLCNLSDIMGTNISAAGSSAELEYLPITYRNLSFDQKWESAPYFNSTTNRLHLLSGSGRKQYIRKQNNPKGCWSWEYCRTIPNRNNGRR